MQVIFRWVWILLLAVLLGTGCREESAGTERVVRIADGGHIVSLDPALAADVGSQRVVNAFFDTLLQYNYPNLPYELRPSMLTEMPQLSEDAQSYTFTLRDDLFFQDDPCFPSADKEARRVTAAAVAFSLLRLADNRLHSATYSLFRGKIKGFDAFYARTQEAAADDFSMYDEGIAGIEVLDERRFAIHLTKADPRFLYLLAIPCTGIVAPEAVKFYGELVGEHPVGSGAFRLEEWKREYKISMVRNPDFRHELFAYAAAEADRSRPLPLADRVECLNTRQPQSSWLLFLQGELDMSVITRDNTDLIAAGGGKDLSPALAARGIQMLRAPSLEVQYIGFNLNDPVLGKNVALRRALTLAYDIPRLVEYANYQMIPATGPLPPGVPEYNADFVNPWGRFDRLEAERQLTLAGYPGGIDPATGKALTLSLDMNGNSPLHRQIGELFASDMAKIGVEVTPLLNNSPRFYQKLSGGQFQLFRLSWKGDYPDAENFLQLFYSGNIGGANRVNYRSGDYDAMWMRYLALPPGPQRQALVNRMLKLLTDDAPWIFESIPVNYHLKHGWLDNYLPYDFSFGAWKYLTADRMMRENTRRAFVPLALDQLQAH